MMRSIEQQIDEKKQDKNRTDYPFSASSTRENDSLENYRKSLMTSWKKHYQSYKKRQQELKDFKTGVFLIESDDIFLQVVKFKDMRDNIIEEYNIPFEIVYDKKIMDFIQQYNSDIQYVIFAGSRIVKILKTSSIPDILKNVDYQNLWVHPTFGLMVKYGSCGAIQF